MAKLDIYQRTDERWAWRLIADNGRIVATDGSQGYEAQGDCEQTASAVVRGFYSGAQVVVVRNRP